VAVAGEVEEDRALFACVVGLLRDLEGAVGIPSLPAKVTAEANTSFWR